MPKMHRDTCGGRAPPKPAGKLMRYRRPSSCNGGLLQGEEGEGKGRGRGYFKRGRKEGKAGERARKRSGREFPPHLPAKPMWVEINAGCECSGMWDVTPSHKLLCTYTNIAQTSSSASSPTIHWYNWGSRRTRSETMRRPQYFSEGGRGARSLRAKCYAVE